MKKSELLREQIKNGQKELAELLEQEHKESRSQTVKELSEFTNEEKIEIFDSLYACAKSNLDSAEENGSESDDDEHYTWEAVMEIMGRNKQLFWEYYNSL